MESYLGVLGNLLEDIGNPKSTRDLRDFGLAKRRTSRCLSG